MVKAKPYSQPILAGDKKQRTFKGDNLLQIAMPIGGIGAGCVCLNGIGGIQDFSIRHRPAISAVPWSRLQDTRDSAFALLHFKGKKPTTRLVEGPQPVEKIYNMGIGNSGHNGPIHEGFPRYEKCSFHNQFPFGLVNLSDPTIPLKVQIKGYNPFIPLDDINSGLPCAILEYTLTNTSKKTVDFDFSYHLTHLAPGSEAEESASRNSVIPNQGIYFSNRDNALSESYGSASLTVVGHEPKIKAMWLRGGWFDAISALWREVSTGSFTENEGSGRRKYTGRNGGSILLPGKLKPGQSITYPIVITWHFPNVHDAAGWPRPATCSGDSCCKQNAQPKWRPFYAGKWKNAQSVAQYVHTHYKQFRKKTKAFADDLFQSTLPSYVIDAVASNLAILKSPTVLRQENGNIWGWEGCLCDTGCCAGSCTHVWNYAQAMCHLFPQLERTLREQELVRSMDSSGHVTFRSALPDGEVKHDFYAASDGQLGGIMKVYREWQISGDDGWLKQIYPLAKRSLEYCIRTWDPKEQGLLEEPHHNTYDIEFWGPDGMCSSFYVGALSAMACMSDHQGNPADAKRYKTLAKRGAAKMNQLLFNGEYYGQKVKFKGLKDKSFEKLIARSKPGDELHQLMQKEGPRYQYATGCLSDGVVGAWIAQQCQIETPLPAGKIKKHLQSVFAYNFKSDLWNHSNCQRPGYALGHEPGLLLCTWPRGGKPTLPFIYSDEVWTGIEYQVAAHLISEGFIDEGLTIVHAARQRYDGRVRNPFNEYECGNYYARALASYALLGALSGFQYSATNKRFILEPKVKIRPFSCFIATATGWGQVKLSKSTLAISITHGYLDIERLQITTQGRTLNLKRKVTVQPGKKIVLKLKDFK